MFSPEELEDCLVEGDQRYEVRTEGTIEPFGATSLSIVKRIYREREGEAMIEVVIIDSNHNDSLTMPFEMGALMSQTFPDGYRRISTARGWPILEEVREDEGYAKYALLVKGRFLIEIRGYGITGLSSLAGFLDGMKLEVLEEHDGGG